MGVYNNAKPLDGAHVFQFSESFASDACWYVLRNLANDEKGITGVRFSYDWKTRDTPSTLKAGSAPETTTAAASSPDAPTSTPTGLWGGGASTARPGSSAAASQTSGGSASSAPGANTGRTTKPPAGASGVPLPNSTVPPINDGTAGGGGESGTHGAASPPLSTGVIAGIVVGSVLGVLGIAGFLAALWLVKRRQRSTVNRQSRLPECESKTSGRVKGDGKCLPGELCGDNKLGLVELPG